MNGNHSLLSRNLHSTAATCQGRKYVDANARSAAATSMPAVAAGVPLAASSRRSSRQARPLRWWRASALPEEDTLNSARLVIAAKRFAQLSEEDEDLGEEEAAARAAFGVNAADMSEVERKYADKIQRALQEV